VHGGVCRAARGARDWQFGLCPYRPARYAKNSDIYGKNSRVRDVEIRFSSGASLHTTLQDKADGEVVTLNQPVASKWVQVVIRSVYPGWKYSDTAINELQVDAR